MRRPRSSGSRILLTAIFYLLIAWGMVKALGFVIATLTLPGWILTWVEVGAYLVFPLIFIWLWIQHNTSLKESIAVSEPDHGGSLAPVKSRRGQAGQKQTIAVLPFINKTSKGGFDYFSEGIAEDLVLALSCISDLNVISRKDSTAPMKVEDIHEIAQRTIIKNVLEGKVSRQPDRLTVDVRLKNTSNNKVLWEDRLEDDLTNVFKMQETILENIVRNLDLIHPGQNAITHSTSNFEVYDLYLQGRHDFKSRGQGLYDCKSKYEKIAAVDPDYSPAHAGLADCYNLIGFYELEKPDNTFPQAKEEALTAIRLNKHLVEAHTSLAFTLMLYDWDWGNAEKEFLLALKLNPGYTTAHHWYAEYLMAMGRQDEAISRSRHAQKHDPLNLIVSTLLGMSYYFSRRFDESIAEGHKTLSMAPDYLPVYIWLGRAYEQKGIYEKAIRILEKGKILTQGGSSTIRSLLAHAYAKSGNPEAARGELQELRLLSKQKYVSAYNFARIHLGLNEKESALDWLEKAYEEKSAWLVWLNVDPSFDELRSEKGFIDILDRIGF